jgi:hypothetical protein
VSNEFLIGGGSDPLPGSLDPDSNGGYIEAA